MGKVTAELIRNGRGPDQERVAERRQRAARIRNAREKLTSDGAGRRLFDVELLRHYSNSHRGSWPAVSALAGAIAVISLRWLQPSDVLGWAALTLAGLWLHQLFCGQLLDLAEPDVAPRQWRQRFMIIEFLRGLVWALIVALLTLEPDHVARTFVLFVPLIVAAMTAMLSATVPLAVISGLAPLALALAIVATREISIGLEGWPEAVTGLVALGYFALLARRLYSTARDTLWLSGEKEALIAELEQAKLNSDEARRRAEEASLAKSRFLATMSHELRTPLNAILGFSEIMKGELLGPHVTPAYKEYSNDIHASGQHLLMLINEILDLSRVEAGRYELKEESCSIAHIVEDCTHLLSLRARNRGITIVSDIAPNLDRVWADERAIRQITLNLLTNAIKFTPTGGSIFITVAGTAEGGQSLSIRDTGPGIPEDEIPVIMSNFGRGALAQKNAEEGTGLGLPIVKGLVELHGGSFTLKSEVRVGTEVIVTLPPERVMDALPMMAQSPERRPLPNMTRSRPAA